MRSCETLQNAVGRVPLRPTRSTTCPTNPRHECGEQRQPLSVLELRVDGVPGRAPPQEPSINRVRFNLSIITAQEYAADFQILAWIACVVHFLNELLCRSFVDEVAISDGRVYRVAPCE